VTGVAAGGAGAASAPAGRPRPDSLIAAALLTALVAIGPLSTDLYLPSLPALTRALGTDVPTAQLTLSVFLAGFALGMLVYGPLSDRFGRRPLLLAGVALYTAGSVACALAPGIGVLIACRFVQSLGAACGPVLARAVVRDVYGRDGAARVLAYMGMAMALAPMVGPVLGGLLTVWIGWRANFWALTAFGAAGLAGVALLLAETNARPDPAATRLARLVRNYGTALGHRGFVGYMLIVAFVFSGIFAFISGSSFLLVDALGLTPDLYGLCFAAVVTGYMAGSFGAGRLTRRLGIDRMIAIGLGVGTAGGLAMAALAWARPPGVVEAVAPYFVFMIGAGLVLPNAMAGGVGPFPRMAGLASSLLGFAQMGIAALVGIAVAHLTDGTARPMAGALLLACLGAAAAFLALVRPAARAAARAAAVSAAAPDETA
jgi:DHA1 family bicyclomycin/chloramphenicol resistance-like MFS transporter